MDRFVQRDLFPQERPPARDDRPPEAPEPAEHEALMPRAPEGAADAPPEGARLTSPSRAQREAKRRRQQAILDDALARMGEPGKQMLSDAESPFARGRRELEGEQRRTKEERKRRSSGGR